VGEVESTAYHEAGHAVASFHTERAVKAISIVPDEDNLGRVSHYPLTGRWFQPDVEIDGRTTHYIETSITVLLAGPAGERRYRGRWNHVGASADYSRALDLAFRLVGSERQLRHYWAWRHQITMDLWENEYAWEQVRRLAEELLERKVLSGRVARDILMPRLSPEVSPGKRSTGPHSL